MTKPKNPKTAQAAEPWPKVGFINPAQMRAALGRSSEQTVRNYITRGLLPAPLWIGPNRRGWPVEQARQALAELPAKVQATRARPAACAPMRALSEPAAELRRAALLRTGSIVR